MRDTGLGQVGGGRGDVDDDASAAPGDHRAGRFPRAGECPPEVDAEYEVPLLPGELEQRGGGVDTGRVYPRIETPQARAHVFGKYPDGCLVAHVDLARDPRRPERRGRPVGRFTVDVRDHYRGAGLGQPGAAGAADAARSPGDDGNLPGQRHQLREGDARGVADCSHEANLSRRAPL